MLQPGQYNPKLMEELNWYLIQELRRTMSDRGELESNWLAYESLYRARPAEDKKDFPFVGASNLVVAVAATDIETLYARMMGLLLEPQNLWSIGAQRPELTEFARATNEFMEWAQKNELDVHSWMGDWILEIHKLGTGILKQRYVRDMKKVFEWRELEQQTWQQQSVILLKDHPSVNHVRLHDFYVPAGFKNLQQAPWCGERIRMTWPQFMNRVKAGLYTNADKVGSYYFAPPINNYQQTLDAISGYQASQNKLLEFYEFWLDFDIDGDGWDEALVCTIHLESQTYVRIDLNPFFNQDKPYSSARFLRDVNSFYGIGLCEMLEQYQEEITAMHNQRIDNGTITNSSMFAVEKNETSVRINEPVYPGKIWRLNSPGNLVQLKMGSGGSLNESLANEQATRAEGQRRTGVTDWQAGNPTSPEMAYGTAYNTQQMLLQSSKRFGETMRDAQTCLSETGTRILELYQQYNPRGKEFIALGPKDGQSVAMVLRFPLDLIRKGLKVSVTAIDASTSKDAQIRTQTLIMQQLAGFYQQTLQMMSYAVNPQMPPEIKQIAAQSIQGSSILMRRLLELYGEQDTDRMIPELNGGEYAQQQQLANIQSLLQSYSGAIGGGRPTPGQPAPPQGMAGLLGAGSPPGPGNPMAGPGIGGQFGGGLPMPGQNPATAAAGQYAR